MKILQICAYSAPYLGNFMKSLFALEKEAKLEGYTTLYCFPEKNKNIEWCIDLEKNNQVYYLPLRHARILPQTYWRLSKIFKENPDICYAHSHFELYDNPLTVTAPKHVKVFWHLHDALGNNLHGIYRYVWKLHYSLFPNRSYLLSVSEKHMRVAIMLGFNKSRAFYIPNAIDIQRIKSVNDDRVSKYDFLMFGWLFHLKGVDLAISSIESSKLGLKLGIVGGNVEDNGDSIRVWCNKRPGKANIKTLPYPGFPTDLQQVLASLLVKSYGKSIIEETIWENRFMHIPELNKMGANVKIVSKHKAEVIGVESLKPANVDVLDLRGGASLVIASLKSNGETIKEICTDLGRRIYL